MNVNPLFHVNKTNCVVRLTTIIITVIICLLGLNSYSQAQCYLKFTGIDTLIDKAVDLFHEEFYFDALEICEEIIKDHPENPMGYLGAAVIYHGIMRNYWINQYEHEFDSLLTIAIKKGESAVKKNKRDAECYFMYGAALGFRGLHRIRKGQWLGAFLDGIKGYKNMKIAYKMNNKLYDAYYGLGLFYYWKSSKAKVLTFLRLMKDEREKGIKFIRIAIEKGRFAPLEGQFALIQIYYYEDRYDEALRECRILENKFSNDPIWLYLMAKILDKKEQWKESQAYFNKLVDKLNKSPYQKSMGFLTECHYGLSKCAYHLNDYETALEESNIALEFSEKRVKEKEIDGPLLDFDVILERLKELNEQLRKYAER